MIVEDTVVQPSTEPVTPAPAAPAAPAPAAPAAPEAGKPGSVKAWKAQLKKELQTNEILDRFDDISSLAEGFLGFEAKKDRLLEIPAADATDDVKGAFRAKLGVPAKPEDYKLDTPELPKELGLKWSPEAEAGFRKLALEAGLNNDQAKALLAFDTARTVARVKAVQDAQKAAVEAVAKEAKAHLSKLETDWGAKFKENSTKAVETMAKVTEPDFLKLMESAKLPDGTKFRDHPLTAKFFFDMAQNVGEGTFIRSGVSPITKPALGPLKLSDEVRASLGI